MLFCAGCASRPIVRTETVTVQVPVLRPLPVELTAPSTAPPLQGNTNAALADYVLVLQHALAEANARLAKLAELSRQP